MGIFKQLFSREFDTRHYAAGHGKRHKVGNIIVYIITTVGSILLLAIPGLIVYSSLQEGGLHRSMVWASIPVWLVAIGITVLMWYGIQKSQMPED